MSTDQLHAVVTRLIRDGDTEAAAVINKLVDDLALSENANEQLEVKTALAEKAREDSEARCEFLIAELEVAVAKTKQMAVQQ